MVLIITFKLYSKHIEPCRTRIEFENNLEMHNIKKNILKIMIYKSTKIF